MYWYYVFCFNLLFKSKSDSTYLGSYNFKWSAYLFLSLITILSCIQLFHLGFFFPLKSLLQNFLCRVSNGSNTGFSIFIYLNNDILISFVKDSFVIMQDSVRCHFFSGYQKYFILLFVFPLLPVKSWISVVAWIWNVPPKHMC